MGAVPPGRLRRVTAGVLALACAAPVLADAWPEFRGPRGDGHSPARNVPLSWSETENVRWKVPIPGRGWSSPVVWESQVWLTTATEDGRRMSVLCLDRATGRTLAQREIFTNEAPEPLGLGREGNTYASPSPVVEAGRVYVHFGTYGTACLDTRTFRTLWQRRDLNCCHSVGPGSSPVLFRNRLILTLDGVDVQYLVALDTKTGKTVWKTPRSGDFGPGNLAEGATPEEQRKAFTTPIIIEWQGKPLLISSGAKATYGYDPLTGRELWKVGYRGFSNASRPVAGDGMAFLNTGYHRAELWAVRLGGTGDVTASHVAWKYTRNVPLNPSPLLLDGLLYLINSGGILTCLDATTGAEVWKERLPGTYTASPLFAGGRLLFFNEAGHCTVIRPGRRFTLLRENRLAEGLMASPAAVDGALILRTRSHVYCIGVGPGVFASSISGSPTFPGSRFTTETRRQRGYG